MKRNYVKPVFIAEAYSFNESFAKDCPYKVDPNTPITFGLKDYLCTNKDNGHSLGGQHEISGKIHDEFFETKEEFPEGYTLTIFGDGKDNDGCQYDWSGPGSSVMGFKKDGTYDSFGTFGEALYGSNPNDVQHAPAYKGIEMYS